MNDLKKITYLPEIQRLLPQSIDAEMGLVASFMISPQYTAQAMEEHGITPEHFHIPAHAIVIGVGLELLDENRPCDFITLTQALRDRGQLDQCGGAAFITGLFTFIPTAVNAAYYAETVAEKHTLRRIIAVGTEFAARSYDEQDQPAAMLDSFEGAVMAIRKNDDGELKETKPKDGAMAAIHAIEQLYERRGGITGLSTGLSQLDRMTDGLHAAQMVVIAARPSMGKTAFAMNMAEHIAIEQKRAVAFFSAEMSSEQLHQRLLCSRARVNMHQVRNGFLAERDFPALTAAACKIAESKLVIVDAVGASIAAIRAKARRMHKKYGLAAVFVDYLQLLRSKTAQASRNREREISEISQGLKNLSKELNLPVVVLAQLNRNAEGRTGSAKGRPMLSDLRESGSIEQDADFVGLLFRDEYYATSDEERAEMEGKATLIIAKQRNGPVGDVPLTFFKEFTRFEDGARDPDPEPREDPRKSKNRDQ